MTAQESAEKTSQARPERPPVVWNNPDGPKHPNITHHAWSSEAMGREIGYNVYLPDGYGASDLRYPVLYFLHGAGGNENSDGPGFSAFVTRLIRSGEVNPAICVFPNGGYSGYRDDSETGIMMETAIIKELIPLIDSTYRTQADRASRAIGGYSMGSAGSVRLALKYPELFSVAGGWGGSFSGRFGEEPLPPEVTSDALAKSSEHVRLLMIIGLDDPGLRGYDRAIDLLTEAKYPFTYRALADVPHNLGLYYELTGDDMVRFLLGEFAPPSG